MKHLAMMVVAAVGPLFVSTAPAREAKVPATSRPAFSGAYIHLTQLFDKGVKADDRRTAYAEMLDRFRASGLRVAMPYVTTTFGTALYDSRLVPGDERRDGDDFGAFLAEARKRRIEVWPVVCVVPSGMREARGILAEQPEWALLDAKGEKIGYLSPCHPLARAWMASVAGEIVAKYRPDGILLDYLRFPAEPIRLDTESQARFDKAFPNHATLGETERKAQLQLFKEQGLTELTRQLSAEVRRRSGTIRVGIYSWGPHVTRAHPIAQVWSEWVSRGYIDMVSISGYCFRDNYGEEYLKVFENRLRDAAYILEGIRGHAELTFTLGVRTSHGRVPNARAINEYLRIAGRVGVRGVAVFTWSSLEPYLDEVLRAGYFREFLDADRGR